VTYKSRRYELLNVQTWLRSLQLLCYWMLRNKFVPSRKKHEPGVGFINDTIQILSQVIVCSADIYEVNFILNKLHNLRSLLSGGIECGL